MKQNLKEKCEGVALQREITWNDYNMNVWVRFFRNLVIFYTKNTIKITMNNLSLLLFLKDFIYLFMRDTERDRDTGRGKSRVPVGSLKLDSVSGPWDPDLSKRQMLNL